MAADRIKELDALRGIAASTVVFFHLTRRYFEDYGRPSEAAFSFSLEGMQAVFLFFILSGFVISMTLEKITRARAFVMSRFSRIFPAFWVSVLITFIVVKALGLPGREVSVTDALLNLTMAVGYLPINPVDVVYWSLTAELSFYVVMWFLHASGWLWNHPYRVAWLWLIYCAVIEALRRSAGLRLPDAIGWFTLASFAPLFIAGIMFYRIYTHRGTRDTHIAIAACFVLHNIINWQGKWQFPATVFSFACFYLVSYRRLDWLRRQPLLFLGTISYPLYLVHDNIGMAIIHALVRRGINYNLALFGAIVAVLLLATAITYSVERPAMKALRARRQLSTAQ
jgi:peptidoglycan/LPS O-acetylase OafA/YrhL